MKYLNLIFAYIFMWAFAFSANSQCSLSTPTVSGTTSLNCGQTTTLTASSNGTSHIWFPNATTLNALATGNSYTTPPMGQDDTVYVEAVNLTNGTQTFNYTGGVQTWTVPTGVYSITVDVRGAAGGGHWRGSGGNGGRVQGVVPVTPGTQVSMVVGQQGSGNWHFNYWASNNAYNGGGRGESCAQSCCTWWRAVGSGGGGGASDIRIGGTGLNNRVVVAGGGGGAGGQWYESCCSNGGAGGGLTGGNGGGWNWPGGGGSQTSGGSAINTQAGSSGSGGNGSCWSTGWGGGGGGGGYFGGGGGNYGGGGGGGSSYTDASVMNVSHSQGFNSGQGQIVISWQQVTCSSQRIAIPISVTNTNTAPTVSGSTYIVCGQTTTLTATGSGNSLYWYADSVGGSPVFTSAAYTTPVLLSNDTFYVETLNTFGGGLEICHSPRTMVPIVVNDTVLPPTIAGTSVICGLSDTLIATGSFGHFRWYNQAVGGTAFSTSDTIITPILTSPAVYYVEATSVSNAPYCVSQRIAVQVGIVSVPNPTVQHDTVICGNASTLTASGSTGNFNWYTQPTGGAPFLANSTSATLTPLTTTTYYVQASSTMYPYSGSQTYTSPGTHTYTVPAGVHSINFDVRGARGGNGWSQGGLGGRVTGTLSVTPGQQLLIYVGEAGSDHAHYGCCQQFWSTFAFNGGGQGNGYGCCGNTGFGGGGGASDIRIGGNGLNNRVVVAGGGGGAGALSSNGGQTGGHGGGLNGGNAGGWNWPGGGGTQTGGGWSNWQWGAFGVGGNGQHNSSNQSGGGGGGGWYGGGGGRGGGGGGGGSSYTDAQLVSNVSHQQAQNNGQGWVNISFNKPFCESQRIPVMVVVDSLPVPTAMHDTVNCSQSALIGASGSSGHYHWFTQPSGGSPFSQGSLLATSPIYQPTTYWVQAYNPTNVCRSPRVPVNVTIDSLPAPSVMGSDTLCDTASTVFIASGAPSNGVYSWFNSPGGTLLLNGSNYSTGVVNDTVIVYVRYNVGQCFSPYTQGTLLVTPTPVATIVAPDSMCSGDASLLLGTGTQGGTWSGTGIVGTSSGMFNPSTATLGLNQIVYSITQSICSASDTTFIVVTQGPDATITDPGAQCAVNLPLTLNAMTAGGLWQGTGITDTVLGLFDPSLAQAGSNMILYSVSSQGCTSLDTLWLTVNPQPNASLASVPVLCSADAPFLLQPAVSGGTFSGNGILNATTGFFDPSLAGAGTAHVTYALSVNNCSSIDSVSIVINATPNATITNPGLICNNQSVFALQSQTQGGTWSGAGISNQQLGTFDPQSAPLGTFSIGYSVTQNGCSATDAIQVTVNQAPDASILSAPSALCSNASSVSLNSLFSGGTWSGTGIVDAQLGILNPSQMTPGNNQITYSLQASNGCVSSNQVVINQLLAPNATILSGNQQICNNNPDVNLYAASNVGVWTGTGIINAGTGMFSPSLVGSGTVDIVYSASQNGCFASDTVQITVIAAPTVMVSPGGFLEFCEGSGFTLTASGASSYMWAKDDVLLPGQNGATHTVQLSGVYTVYGMDGLCGTLSANVPVQVNPAPIISQVIAPSVCEGLVTQFSSNATIPQNTGSVIATYLWDYGDGTSASGNVTQHTYASAGSYNAKLIVTSNKGCVDSLTQVVHVNPIPQIQSLSAPNVCFPNLSQFSASASVAPINNASIQHYNWNFGNGQQGIGTNPSNQYNQPGPYTYTLSVVTNHGCTSSQSASTMIYKKPLADFSYTDVCTHIAAQFADLSDGFGDSIVSWNWNFGDGIGISSMQNPVYQYNVPAGTYSVVLNVLTQSGCSSSRQRFVSVSQSPNPQWNAQFFGISSVNFSPVNPNPNVTFVWHFPHDNTYYYQTNLSKNFPATGGNYQVCLSAQQNGCNVTECGNIYISPLGIDGAAIASFTVYPNPFSDYIRIEWESDSDLDAEIELYDLSGRLVHRSIHSARKGLGTLNLYTSDLSLSSGTYLLSLRQGEVGGIQRVIHISEE